MKLFVQLAVIAAFAAPVFAQAADTAVSQPAHKVVAKKKKAKKEDKKEAAPAAPAEAAKPAEGASK